MLDSNSPVPLYYQMEQIILDRITKRDAVGRMLPTEKELMQIFGVSRATVKNAYNNLVAKGMIERRRALGTRVIRQEITEDLARLTSYTEEMVQKGLVISTQVLGVECEKPSPEIAEKLSLRPSEKVISIRRLRGTSEFFPVVLLKSVVAESLGIRVDENFDGSLYSLLEDEHGIPIEWGQEEIRAAAATEYEAQQLGLRPGSAVLVMERVSYTRGNRPVEFVRGVYNPEHYKYSIRLKR